MGGGSTAQPRFGGIFLGFEPRIRVEPRENRDRRLGRVNFM
jgi:hypothetical protein